MWISTFCENVVGKMTFIGRVSVSTYTLALINMKFIWICEYSSTLWTCWMLTAYTSTQHCCVYRIHCIRIRSAAITLNTLKSIPHQHEQRVNGNGDDDSTRHRLRICAGWSRNDELFRCVFLAIWAFHWYVVYESDAATTISARSALSYSNLIEWFP